MLSYHIERNEAYQDKEGKRRGRAVYIAPDVVTLQTRQGDNYVVATANVKSLPVMEDESFLLTLSDKAPRSKDSLFLYKRENSESVCLGTAKWIRAGTRKGQWKVAARSEGNNKPLGYYLSQQAAINALWVERWHL